MAVSVVAAAITRTAPPRQPFTRATGPTVWPEERRFRPLDHSFRSIRDLNALTQALPAALTPLLRERFKPTRGPLRWETPPALPLSFRQGYALAALRAMTNKQVCTEITITAGLIERLLEAPEGMVGGLTHNFLLAMQMWRLRQLWEEVQRRDWAEARLKLFAQALG